MGDRHQKSTLVLITVEVAECVDQFGLVPWSASSISQPALRLKPPVLEQPGPSVCGTSSWRCAIEYRQMDTGLQNEVCWALTDA